MEMTPGVQLEQERLQRLGTTRRVKNAHERVQLVTELEVDFLVKLSWTDLREKGRSGTARKK